MNDLEYEEYEGDETTQEGEMEGEGEGDGAEGELEEQDQDHDQVPLFDPHPPGMKEISNLGKFTVSTHKQDNGVEELRSEDLTKFWQSDGTQPHNLTVYFVKKVAIREIRFYVDYEQDESYTPTRIIFRSGTSENNLIQFATMDLAHPKGWQKVPIEGVGGGHDGNTLYSWVLQMSVTENHQNGKDTHLRGIRIFSPDNDVPAGGNEKNVTKAPWIIESLLEHGPQPFWGPPPYRNPEHDVFGHDSPEFRRMYPEYYEPELMWPPAYGPWPLGRRSINWDAFKPDSGIPIESLLGSDSPDPDGLAPPAGSTASNTPGAGGTSNNNPNNAARDARARTVESLLESFETMSLPEYMREPQLR